MAMAQPYPQAYMQPANKGTLVPGQAITVNKYTVQVERYLSQGGFAHVYLVRTATPVYNTTQHVLKRIAVPTEAMLSEVKKEVDIMRILRGHPNIVYLIDAAWHRLPNGTYEVFILMEFCAGGGIIDMMNRRLRERLTEPEILTIFCDVCEGLAAMHALKPPLLHRDLKVENILQASETVYKLCDFGSATPVQKVPTTTQEIRMLEADLNRHTTLQYRAPEMVDVYLRRPIDEKSDVWALGVLLYKLCYYTTPFEEHGPLAILNVQYKIPPYPVYSNQMNALIASMLREHGAQRPAVFEILAHVHKLRGTKSRFSYNISPSEPPLSLHTVTSPPLQALSPNVVPPQPQPNPMDQLVAYRSPGLSTSPAKSAGIEARDKVLEAIAPMRRGRPTPPASPKKEQRTLDLDSKFSLDEDRLRRGVRGHKSGLASISSPAPSRPLGDAWDVGPRGARRLPQDNQDSKAFEKAFGEDFSTGFGKSFGDSFQPARSPAPGPTAAQAPPSPKPQPAPSPVPAPASSITQLRRNQSVRKAKDAFEGLGLAAQPPPQTLGEVRRNRTVTGGGMPGGTSSAPQFLNAPFSQPNTNGIGTSNTMYRPPSAHSPMPSPSPKPQAQLPASSPMPSPQMASWRSQSKTPSSQGQTAEERFPSLEELDREFASPPPGPGTAYTGLDRLAMGHALTQPPPTERPFSGSRPPSRANYMRSSGAGAQNLESTPISRASRGVYDGSRSQNVTGTAMRESRFAAEGFSRQPSMLVRPTPLATGSKRMREKEEKLPKEKQPDVTTALRSRPSAARRRKHSGKSPSRSRSGDLLSPISPTAPTPALPPRPQTTRSEPRDWLTGADEDDMPHPPGPEPEPQPIMRESPSKRASLIERSPIALQFPLEAESVPSAFEIPATQRESSVRPEPSWGAQRERSDGDRKAKEKSRERRQRSPTKSYVSRAETGKAREPSRGRLQLPPVDTKAASSTNVSPAHSGLNENWSPITAEAPARKSGSSSSDDGPEDLQGYASKRNVRERVKAAESTEDKRRRAKSKGRQGSVHDLVDLWDGDKPKDRESDRETERERPSVLRQAEKRRSVIMPAPPLSAKPRSESPAQLIDTGIPARLASSQAQVQVPPGPRRQPSTAPTPKSVFAPSPALPSMSGRARPQSMFLTSSVSKTASFTSTSTETAAGALSPPADPLAARRGSRRSSISDMVQHYETIGGSTKGSGLGLGAGPTGAVPSPLVVSKPSSLITKARSQGRERDGESAILASPSATALRFPKLSPTSSPVLGKASLAVPDEPTQSQSQPSRRASPSGLPARTSPLGRRDMPFSSRPSADNNDASVSATAPANGLPSRRSPLHFSTPSDPAPAREDPPPMPSFPLRRTTTAPAPAPAEEPTVRSPSPEKPYQGVSKLIDRWNRAVDQSSSGADAKRGAQPIRRAGVVGGQR